MTKPSASKKKTILLYGLKPNELLPLLSLAKSEGITCKTISDNETTFTVSQLLSGAELPPKPPYPLLGKYALLDGFNGQEHIAAAFINQCAAGVIKAVHTTHNGDWPFAELCAAIHEEYQVMHTL